MAFNTILNRSFAVAPSEVHVKENKPDTSINIHTHTSVLTLESAS